VKSGYEISREPLEFNSIMKSDWPTENKSCYVTEPFSGSSSLTLFFGVDKRQAEIRLHSQAVEHFKIINTVGFPNTGRGCSIPWNHWQARAVQFSKS